MGHLKQCFVSAAIAFVFSALLAIGDELTVIISAGVLGATAVTIIFVLVLAAVKLAQRTRLNSSTGRQYDPAPRRLTGFDAEGNLMIHSWLWHGGK